MIYSYPRVPHLKRMPINISASGDNVVVAADTVNRIVIHRLWFVVRAATDLTFKDNLASPGAIPMIGGGAMLFDLSGEPWFITDVNTAFIINSSVATNVCGEVYYTLAV